MKYLFIALLFVLLLEAGCTRSPLNRRVSNTSPQQNIPDYAKVQLVPSDQNSQILKFSGQIYNALFSSDGHVLVVETTPPDSPEYDKQPVTTRIDDVLHFWDLNTHQLTHYIVLRNQVIEFMAFSPDGKYLAASVNQSPLDDKYSKEYLYIWDAHSTKLLKRILLSAPSSAYGAALEFSPNGHLLSLNFLWDILLINTSSWKKVKKLHLVRDAMLEAYKLSFSPDGKKLAASSCNLNTESVTLWALTVWNTQTGKVQMYLDDSKFVLDPHNEYACPGDVGFLSDNHTLAMGRYLFDTHHPKHKARKLAEQKTSPVLNSTKYVTLDTCIAKNKQLAVLLFNPKTPKAKTILWDLKSKKVLYTWDKAFTQKIMPYDDYMGASLSTDGKWFIFNTWGYNNNNILQIWNIR